MTVRKRSAGERAPHEGRPLGRAPHEGRSLTCFARGSSCGDVASAADVRCRVCDPHVAGQLGGKARVGSAGNGGKKAGK